MSIPQTNADREIHAKNLRILEGLFKALFRLNPKSEQYEGTGATKGTTLVKRKSDLPDFNEMALISQDGKEICSIKKESMPYPFKADWILKVGDNEPVALLIRFMTEYLGIVVIADVIQP